MKKLIYAIGFLVGCIICFYLCGDYLQATIFGVISGIICVILSGR